MPTGEEGSELHVRGREGGGGRHTYTGIHPTTPGHVSPHWGRELTLVESNSPVHKPYAAVTPPPVIALGLGNNR